MNASSAKTVYEFKATDIDGRERALNEFAGQALLIVNVASKCGLTPQYDALQKIHAEYADKGFAVLGFPCNQFAGQEPGSDADVKAFCCAPVHALVMAGALVQSGSSP